MARWEDIQAEVLRQDIAELEKSLAGAEGIQKETYRRQIKDLQTQLATIKNGLLGKTPETTPGKKAKQKQELDQFKQKFGGKTRTNITSGSSSSQHTGSQISNTEHNPHPEVADERARILKMAKDFEIAMLTGDNQEMKRVLGLDIIEARKRSLEKRVASLKEHSAGKARLANNKKVVKQALEVIEEMRDCGDLMKQKLWEREKIHWTIVTTPQFATPITAIFSIPLYTIGGRWRIFKISRQQKALISLRRKFQFLLYKRL